MSVRPGPWMEAVKSVLGILMFIAAFYFLKNVVPPLAHFASARPAFEAGEPPLMRSICNVPSVLDSIQPIP